MGTIDESQRYFVNDIKEKAKELNQEKLTFLAAEELIKRRKLVEKRKEALKRAEDRLANLDMEILSGEIDVTDPYSAY